MDIIDIDSGERKQDKGFTLVELLIVIVILGILATVTVFAVRGITDKGQTSACNTDKATLQTAVESYFAQYGSNLGGIASSGTATPAAVGGVAVPAVVVLAKPSTTPAVTWTEGANPELTLVAAGFLRAVPTNFWVAQDGSLYSQNAACGALNTKAG